MHRSYSWLGLTLAIMISIISGLSPELNAQWLQWGGPGRDFKSPETGLLDSWPEDGPPLLWQKELAGNYASLLVDGDRIYSMFGDADDREIVRCLRAKDASIVWEHTYKVQPVPEVVLLDFGRGPNVTPAISEDFIIGVGFLGEAWCLRKSDGSVVWSRNLVNEFGAKTHMFGYSISPLVLGDNVVLATGGDQHGVVALEVSSGKLAWRSEPVDVSYTSPFLIAVDGQQQIVLMASTEVVGLRPTDGAILWRFPHANLNKNNCSTPLWGQDQILFLSSHSDGGGDAIKLNQTNGKTTVQHLWHNNKIHFFHTSALRLRDYVYGANGTWPPTFLVAIDVKTGKILWQERGFNKANLLYFEDKVILLDEDGVVTLARLSPEELTVLSSFKGLEKTAWAPPTLANGILYLRDQKSVRAFDIRGDK